MVGQQTKVGEENRSDRDEACPCCSSNALLSAEDRKSFSRCRVVQAIIEAHERQRWRILMRGNDSGRKLQAVCRAQRMDP